MGIFLYVVLPGTQRSFHLYSMKSKRAVKFSVTAIHVHYKHFSYVKVANRAYANTAFPTQDHSSNFPYFDTCGNPVNMLRTVAIKDRKPCKQQQKSWHTYTHTLNTVQRNKLDCHSGHCTSSHCHSRRDIKFRAELGLSDNHRPLLSHGSLVSTSWPPRTQGNFPHLRAIFPSIFCSHLNFPQTTSLPCSCVPLQLRVQTIPAVNWTSWTRFDYLYRSLGSVSVLDLHSSFFFTGPVIFLKMFLSNTAKIFVSFTSRFQVSAAHLITGRATIRCILSLMFRDCIVHFKMGHQASQQRLSTNNPSLISIFVPSSYVSTAPIHFNILSLSMRLLESLFVSYSTISFLKGMRSSIWLVGWLTSGRAYTHR